MKKIVLDASVGLAWFLDDPVPDLAQRVRRSLENGSRALVPSLWHLEVANGFAIGQRRGILSESHADRCLDDIEGLMALVIEDGSSTVSLRQALTVARAFGLTAYDATYLETARREHLPLATLDKQLLAAASKAGVEIVS